MSTKDEELQNQIDKGTSAIEGGDAQAYKRVFDALKKEPDFYLSSSFAEKVVAKMKAKKELSRDFIWICTGIVAFVIAAIVSIALTDFKLKFGAFKFMAGYPGLVGFGVGFVLVLHYLDKKLIRPTISGL